MSILKVARMGHPVLRARARTVDKAELKNPVFQHFVTGPDPMTGRPRQVVRILIGVDVARLISYRYL